MKKTTIILSLSLLINVFLIGYLTGNKFLHKHPRHDRYHPHFNKELRHELKAKRQELFEIIGAKDFDEAIFDAKIKEIEATHNKIKSQMPERLKRKVLGKTQEERIKVLEKIKSRHKHR